MVILAWANIRAFSEKITATGIAILFGGIMGAGSVLSICLSFAASPGFYVDLRAAPIAVAGLFGGPVVAGLAMIPALIYRAWLGGAGALPGCASIVAIGAGAALCHGRMTTSAGRLLVSAAMIAAVGLVAGQLIAPEAARKTAAWDAVIPLFILNVAGISLASLALLLEEQRRAMSAANALYRAIIQALPDCLNVKDGDGKFLVANPATANLMGAESAEALVGKSDFDFYPETTAQAFRNDEELALKRRGPPKAIEQKAAFRDGAIAYLSTLKIPFHDANGQFMGLITHNRDITDRKLVELKLRETQQQLSAALENMADGLVVYDDAARIVLCNEQYRDLFPLTADLRVAGASLPEIIGAAVARGEEAIPDGADIDVMIARALGSLQSGGARQIVMKDGRRIEARTRPALDGGALTVFSDVTERYRLEQTLRFHAERDPLTGLANRAPFLERLSLAFERQRDGRSEIAVLMVDLDRFKETNDTFGHLCGDKLLVEIASRLRAACRSSDMIARLGGDEFVILIEAPDMSLFLGALAQRIVDSVSSTFEFNGARFPPSCSVGVAVSPHDALTGESLMVRADEALYRAKRNGRNTWIRHGDVERNRKRTA